MTNRSAVNGLVFLLLSLLVFVGRLVPHWPNFAPAASAALFAGFFFRQRRVAVLAVLLGLIAGDFIIGAYDWRMMAIVYCALCLPAIWGPWLRSTRCGVETQRAKRIRRIGAALRLGTCAGLSSVAFFALSNFAVWLFSGMYTLTWAGLAQCYVAAIPFLHFTLLGDLTYSTGLFGAYALASGVLRVEPSYRLGERAV